MPVWLGRWEGGTVKPYPCSTGNNSGDKIEQGDKWTPQGITFLTGRGRFDAFIKNGSKDGRTKSSLPTCTAMHTISGPGEWYDNSGSCIRIALTKAVARYALRLTGSRAIPMMVITWCASDRNTVRNVLKV